MTEFTDIQMSYEGLVAAGREAREQIDGYQWTEGDLALQVEKLTPEQLPQNSAEGGGSPLKRYAEDIDVPYGTIKTHRQTAEAWPQAARAAAASWRVYYLLASQEDRFDLIHDGMTAKEAERIVRKRSQATQHPPGWFEIMGEAADHLLKAQKQLDKLDAAISRKPNADFRKRAGRYAGIADDIAERLRAIEVWDRPE